MTRVRRIGILLAGFVLAFSSVSPIVWTAGSALSFEVFIEEQENGFRFSIDGENYTAIRAQVMGLEGRTRFDSGWVNGRMVAWSRSAESTRIAPNGVYLYAISVRDREGREQRKLGKLALIYGQEPAFSVSTVG